MTDAKSDSEGDRSGHFSALFLFLLTLMYLLALHNVFIYMFTRFILFAKSYLCRRIYSPFSLVSAIYYFLNLFTAEEIPEDLLVQRKKKKKPKSAAVIL